MAPEARRAWAATGLLPSVILAQWGNETGFGTSAAWRDLHNPAGIGWNGRTYFRYASTGAGVDGWIATMRLPAYAAVREAHGFHAQCFELGRSPWAGGHYLATPSGEPGAALVNLVLGHNLTRFDPPTPAKGLLAMLLADAQLFVRYLYLELLLREPDAWGFAFWTQWLVNGTKDAEGVLTGIADSDEGAAVRTAKRKAIGLPA